MSSNPIKKSKEVIILSGEDGDYLGWGWSGLSLEWDRDGASGGCCWYLLVCLWSLGVLIVSFCITHW